MRIETLLQMLTYKRPAYSRTQQTFINRFLRPLGVKHDSFGNVMKQIGDSPTVLWSCHTDTVHRNPGKQTVRQRGNQVTSDSGVLGADDTAGCWIMREMILEEVPGLYVFHQGEEIGCVGSSAIACNTPELLSGIRYAIAFDRRGDADVITHQCMSRCCSDDFAFALANHVGARYAPSDAGIYTDTAEYVDLVPECTNLSVGYSGEHSCKETLDTSVVEYLLDRMLELDPDSLPVVRDPSVRDNPWSRYLDNSNIPYRPARAWEEPSEARKYEPAYDRPDCEEPLSDEYIQWGDDLYKWDEKRQVFLMVRRGPYMLTSSSTASEPESRACDSDPSMYSSS